MSDVYLTFGITRTGDWRSIEEVESGRVDLFCPYCKSPLIAKKGRIKVYHFAHEGETCRVAADAVKQTRLPTLETFELLDANEQKYLERRQKYKDHRNIYAWPGMYGAIERLEVMQILSVEKHTDTALENARLRLKKLGDEWLDSREQPSPQLAELFNALKPLIDLHLYWQRSIRIETTQIAREYHKHKLDKQRTLAGLEAAQRYWFDAFWRRQQTYAPDYLELLYQKVKALNRQALYVMQLHGDFGRDLPASMIKIGMTARDPEERLKEVVASLKPHGKRITGTVLAVKEKAGRLEKLIHHFLKADNLTVGRYREYFHDTQLDSLLKQLAKLAPADYLPPADEIFLETAPSPRTRKKSRLELLAEYPDIVSRLEAGRGIREISRDTKHGVNTVQKVKKTLAG
jgi:hypothetical protein